MKFNSFFAIEKKKRSTVLESKIDRNKYMGFSSSSRTPLTEYSIALGIDRPVPITSKDSLLRPDYVENNPKLKTLITCAAINSLKPGDNIEEILTEKNIFDIAESCMNGGLEVIENDIDNMTEVNFKLNKIDELNKLYKKNVVD